MTRLIVFDLDGTLALGHHREHHLRAEPKNWLAYFDACGDDVPNAPIVLAYEALYGWPDHRVEIWTGRVDSHERQTREWIAEHLLFEPDALRMRLAGDRTNDDELKRAWLHEERARGNEVALVFEDRARVVAMWRAEGVTCAQVAPGEF